MSAAVDDERAKAELEAVLASGIFAKAPSLAQVLKYVCTQYFEGQAEQIKEYNIAVEALGRPPDFDQKKDSIVRVEAFRLRKRLKQYYENEGADHLVRIVIPPGQYVPQFLQKAAPAPPAAVPAPNVSIRTQRPVEASWVRHATLLGLVLAAFGLAAAGFLFFHSRARTISASAPAVTPTAGDSDGIRILAGSSLSRYVDCAGDIWYGDRFFHGGSVFATPDHPISGTPDPEMFRVRREGNFSYDIPLKPGVYELHLYFAETLFGENNTAGGGESSRVFRVSVNGVPRLSAFDVIADAGGSNTADEKVFTDIAPAADGMLHLRFEGLVNNVPFLNALEILPGTPGRMRPVRIVTVNHDYTDHEGRVWGADRYFSHGSTVARSDPVAGTPDPEIFRAERFGNFQYTIPVSDGRYRVTLKFAETWFGPGQPGGGGEGSRSFDVYCNGAALLRNFDIFRAAGGDHRATERIFRGVTPNAQGKIVLSFVPVTNYACVNAIEVVDDNE
jgi:hypothetical protein